MSIKQKYTFSKNNLISHLSTIKHSLHIKSEVIANTPSMLGCGGVWGGLVDHVCVNLLATSCKSHLKLVLHL